MKLLDLIPSVLVPIVVSIFISNAFSYKNKAELKQIREEMQQYKDIKSFSNYLKEDKKAKAAFDELKDCIIIGYTKERVAENKERYMLVWRFSCIKQIE